MTTLSLRARLTLWYTLALVVVLVPVRRRRVVGPGRHRRASRRSRAGRRDATVANVIRGELSEHATPASAAEEARRTVDRGRDARSRFSTRQGAPLAASWNGLELRAAPVRRRPRTDRLDRADAGRAPGAFTPSRRAFDAHDADRCSSRARSPTCGASSTRCRKRWWSAIPHRAAARRRRRVLARLGRTPADHRHGAAGRRGFR